MEKTVKNEKENKIHSIRIIFGISGLNDEKRMRG